MTDSQELNKEHVAMCELKAEFTELGVSLLSDKSECVVSTEGLHLTS